MPIPNGVRAGHAHTEVGQSDNDHHGSDQQPNQRVNRDRRGSLSVIREHIVSTPDALETEPEQTQTRETEAGTSCDYLPEKSWCDHLIEIGVAPLIARGSGSTPP